MGTVAPLRRLFTRLSLAAAALGGLTAAASAEPVDVELVLAVDVSLSMSPAELDIQRKGYAAALTDPKVLEAIEGGAYGRIAVTYFEWAGNAMQKVIVPWTVVASAADAEAVAAQLQAMPPASARRTSISGALEFAADLMAESPFESQKRVIDISGDGPNNQGAPVTGARDAVVAQGIVINGLPLMTNGGRMSVFDVANLDRYYADCVVGGPGSFTVPVTDWAQFPEAIRRKLVLELAGGPAPLEPASLQSAPVIFAQAGSGVDCLLGEKMWRDRSLMFELR